MIVSTLQGPFTGYVEGGWCRLLRGRATVVIVCDVGVEVVVAVKGKGEDREYIFSGGDIQSLVKGRYVKVVVKGSGEGYVRLIA